MQREELMLEKIKCSFPGYKIINPGEPNFQNKIGVVLYTFPTKKDYIKPFLDIIDGCDCLVFMAQTTGKLGIGTFLEVRHAETTGKPVYTLSCDIFTTQYRLEECHTHSGKKDWASNYAEVFLI